MRGSLISALFPHPEAVLPFAVKQKQKAKRRLKQRCCHSVTDSQSRNNNINNSKKKTITKEYRWQ